MLFFLIYASLAFIIYKYRVSFHLYADDTQIHLRLKRNDKHALIPLLDCINELKLCLPSKFFFFLNHKKIKSEIIMLITEDNSDFDLGSLAPYKTQCTRNLDFLFKSSLKKCDYC